MMSLEPYVSFTLISRTTYRINEVIFATLRRFRVNQCPLTPRARAGTHSFTTCRVPCLWSLRTNLSKKKRCNRLPAIRHHQDLGLLLLSLRCRQISQCSMSPSELFHREKTVWAELQGHNVCPCSTRCTSQFIMATIDVLRVLYVHVSVVRIMYVLIDWSRFCSTVSVFLSNTAS